MGTDMHVAALKCDPVVAGQATGSVKVVNFDYGPNALTVEVDTTVTCVQSTDPVNVAGTLPIRS